MIDGGSNGSTGDGDSGGDGEGDGDDDGGSGGGGRSGGGTYSQIPPKWIKHFNLCIKDLRSLLSASSLNPNFLIHQTMTTLIMKMLFD